MFILRSSDVPLCISMTPCSSILILSTPPQTRPHVHIICMHSTCMCAHIVACFYIVVVCHLVCIISSSFRRTLQSKKTVHSVKVCSSLPSPPWLCPSSTIHVRVPSRPASPTPPSHSSSTTLTTIIPPHPLVLLSSKSATPWYVVASTVSVHKNI